MTYLTLRAERLKNKLCGSCGMPSVQGLSVCEVHREKARVATAAMRKVRKLKDVCVNCGDPRAENKYLCFECWVGEKTSVHSLNKQDIQRFINVKNCDWCGYDLTVNTACIDHDRRCCNSNRHCWKCTRGLVHSECNIHAIHYCEWLEREFGETDPRLVAYRLRFPVPRVE